MEVIEPIFEHNKLGYPICYQSIVQKKVEIFWESIDRQNSTRKNDLALPY